VEGVARSTVTHLPHVGTHNRILSFSAIFYLRWTIGNMPKRKANNNQQKPRVSAQREVGVDDALNALQRQLAAIRLRQNLQWRVHRLQSMSGR